METLRNALETRLSLNHERCRRVMEVNSHSSNLDGIELVQSEFAEWFAELGFEAEWQETDGKKRHLLLSRGVQVRSANIREGLLLVGHADTAHPRDSAFQHVRIEGDKFCGPGGYDMKAGVVLIALALESVMAVDPHCMPPTRVLIVGDEEVGMQDSFELHRKAAELSRYGLVFESGRPDNLVILTRKGIAMCELISRGKKAHSANEFWQGVNALLPLCEAAKKIAALTDREKNLTLNIGVMNGGISPTIVPDEAQLRFDIRTPTQEIFNEAWWAVEQIVAEINAQGAQLELKRQLFVPPMEKIEGVEKLASSYLNALHECELPGSANTNIIGGASSACLLTSFGLPTIDALGPFGEGAHTDDEWFSIRSLTEKAYVFARWYLQAERFLKTA